MLVLDEAVEPYLLYLRDHSFTSGGSQTQVFSGLCKRMGGQGLKATPSKSQLVRQGSKGRQGIGDIELALTVMSVEPHQAVPGEP